MTPETASREIPTSVVVVSRGRPAALRRCLLSLWIQDHPDLEVVVVADSPGLRAISDLPFAHRLKTSRFDRPGISDARNRGLSLADGAVVAFLDDDAAAMPDWARRLAQPFRDPTVLAATGFVLGRDGVSLQWGGTAVDREGQDHPVDSPPDRHSGLCLKLLGTNMAVRRSALERLGGFDGGYRYFLDDTDLSLRLGALTGRTVLAPEARVQHDFLANACRRADRAPTDLTEIGASCAHFLSRHCAPERRAAALRALRRDLRRRAMPHMVRGALEPGDIRRLLAGFDAGAGAGDRRRDAAGWNGARLGTGFATLRSPGDQPAPQAVLACDPARASETRATAAALASGGHAAIVRVRGGSRPFRQFTDAGYWLESDPDAGTTPWISLGRWLSVPGLDPARRLPMEAVSCR